MLGTVESIEYDGERVHSVCMRFPSREHASGSVTREVRMCELIGQGSFGTVYRALCDGYARLAVKISTGKAARLRQELDVLSRVCTKGKLVLPRFEFGSLNHSGDLLVIGMELCVPSTLHDLLLSTRLTDEADMLFLAYQAVQAVACVHDENCIHRDIKLQNFVFDLDGNLKLIDFGLSCNTLQPPPGDVVAGTVSFMSPEMAHNALYRDRRVSVGEAADVWSLGIVLFSIFTQRNPYPMSSSPAREDAEPHASRPHSTAPSRRSSSATSSASSLSRSSAPQPRRRGRATSSTKRSRFRRRWEGDAVAAEVEVREGADTHDTSSSARLLQQEDTSDPLCAHGHMDDEGAAHAELHAARTTTKNAQHDADAGMERHDNHTKQDRNRDDASRMDDSAVQRARNEQLLRRVAAGQWQWPPGGCHLSESLVTLVTDLLRVDPTQRPSVRDILHRSLWTRRRRCAPPAVTVFLGVHEDLWVSHDEAKLLRAVEQRSVGVVAAASSRNPSRLASPTGSLLVVVAEPELVPSRSATAVIPERATSAATAKTRPRPTTRRARESQRARKGTGAEGRRSRRTSHSARDDDDDDTDHADANNGQGVTDTNHDTDEGDGTKSGGASVVYATTATTTTTSAHSTGAKGVAREESTMAHDDDSTAAAAAAVATTVQAMPALQVYDIRPGPGKRAQPLREIGPAIAAESMRQRSRQRSRSAHHTLRGGRTKQSPLPEPQSSHRARGVSLHRSTTAIAAEKRVEEVEEVEEEEEEQSGTAHCAEERAKGGATGSRECTAAAAPVGTSESSYSSTSSSTSLSAATAGVVTAGRLADAAVADNRNSSHHHHHHHAIDDDRRARDSATAIASTDSVLHVRHAMEERGDGVAGQDDSMCLVAEESAQSISSAEGQVDGNSTEIRTACSRNCSDDGTRRSSHTTDKHDRAMAIAVGETDVTDTEGVNGKDKEMEDEEGTAREPCGLLVDPLAAIDSDTLTPLHVAAHSVRSSDWTETAVRLSSSLPEAAHTTLASSDTVRLCHPCAIGGCHTDDNRAYQSSTSPKTGGRRGTMMMMMMMDTPSERGSRQLVGDAAAVPAWASTASEPCRAAQEDAWHATHVHESDMHTLWTQRALEQGFIEIEHTWLLNSFRLIIEEDQERYHLSWLAEEQAKSASHAHSFREMFHIRSKTYRYGIVCDVCDYEFLPHGRAQTSLHFFHCPCGRDICPECFVLYQRQCTCELCHTVFGNSVMLRRHVCQPEVCLTEARGAAAVLPSPAKRPGGKKKATRRHGEAGGAGKTSTTPTAFPVNAPTKVKTHAAAAAAKAKTTAKASETLSWPSTLRRGSDRVVARLTREPEERFAAPVPSSLSSPFAASSSSSGLSSSATQAACELSGRRSKVSMTAMHQKVTRASEVRSGQLGQNECAFLARSERSMSEKFEKPIDTLPPGPWRPFDSKSKTATRSALLGQAGGTLGLDEVRTALLPTQEERDAVLSGDWIRHFYLYPAYTSQSRNGELATSNSPSLRSGAHVLEKEEEAVEQAEEDDEPYAFVYHIQPGRTGAVFLNAEYPLHSAVFSMLERQFLAVDRVDLQTGTDATRATTLLRAKSHAEMRVAFAALQEIVAYDTNMLKQHHVPGRVSIYQAPRSAYTANGLPFVYVRWFRFSEDGTLTACMLSNGAVQVFVKNECELRWLDENRKFVIRCNGVCEVVEGDNYALAPVINHLLYDDF